MVLNPILAWITTEIVKAGVKKLLLLFAPAGAIIEAIKAIYHIITFFIDNIREIGAFLEAVGESIAQIVDGQISAAAKYIENALERAMLLVIRFLANYLGLSGIASRIRDIVESISKPIENAVDRLIGWLVERGRGLIGRVAGIGTGSLTPDQKLAQAMNAAQRAVNRFSGSRVGEAILRPILGGIRLRYGLRTLEPLPRAGHWVIHGVINPEATVDTDALVGTPAAAQPAPGAPTTVPAQVAVGAEIQLAGSGGGWRPYPYRITILTTTHVEYRFAGTDLPRSAVRSGMSQLNEFGRHWRLYLPESGDLPHADLLAFNGGANGTNTRWNDMRIARKVLNYRYSGSQINPPGKEWEHIIEHSAGGPNSVDNLALADATVNRDLGTWFGQRQPSAPGFPNTGALTAREFLDAANAGPRERRRWKMRAYDIYRVKLLPLKNEGRGPYQILE